MTRSLYAIAAARPRAEEETAASCSSDEVV
uniref:Uncharacterized protein n=1 Tax=Arundo donax TaxID=35708 RepID=A0A0A9PXK8_ARUDO